MLAFKVARILGAARLAGGALALMLLAACGQKGPLYLPPNSATPPSQSQRNVLPLSAPDEDDTTQAPASK